MASYRLKTRNGSRQVYVNKHPWMARRKRAGVEYVLGYFDTREEAEAAEQRFDEWWPGDRGHTSRTRVRTETGYCYV